MNEKQLKNLKQDYNNIPIPAELSQRVQAAIAKEAEEHSIVQKPRRIWRGGVFVIRWHSQFKPCRSHRFSWRSGIRNASWGLHL